MKTMDALKLAGIVAAGVAAYLVVTRTVKAGGDVVAGVKKVVTEDLNPASGKNVVTTALQSTPAGMKFHIWLGDKLGALLDPSGYAAMHANDAAIEEMKKGSGGHSNTATQAQTLAPTGAVGGQSSPAYAATDPRRLDLPQTQAIEYDFNTNPAWNTGL